MSNQNNPIKKITIENFQSHKKTTIIPANFGELTIIVGESRQGKTAIFRALRWLFYNAPDGAGFIRWGCTFAKVTAEYADGTQVSRYRTAGGVNRYLINVPGQKEQVYEGFGRGMVPLEVQQVTGIAPVEIGEGLELTLNLAEQLDGPFLGNQSISSTSRAKVLGKLAGTEAVDLAGKHLGTDLYRWKRDAEAEEKRIEDTKTQLKEYDYLPGFKMNLDKLAKINIALKKKTELQKKIETLQEEYLEINNQIERQRLKLLQLGTLVKDVDPLLQSLEKGVALSQLIIYLESQWKENSASILNAKQIIGKTNKVSEADDVLTAVKNSYERMSKLKKLATQQDCISQGLNFADLIIKDTDKVYEAEKLFNLLHGKAEAMVKAKKLASHWMKIGEESRKVNRILDLTAKYAEADAALNGVSAAIDQKKKLTLLYGTWESVKDVIEDKNKQIFLTNEKVKVLQNSYIKTLKQSGKCPWCGADAKKMNIKGMF